MKKIILTLGSAAAALAPITAVVACEEATPEDPDATPPVEDNDPTNLKLLGYKAPDIDYPTDTAGVTAAMDTLNKYLNTFAEKLGTGEDITSITYGGKLSYFVDDNWTHSEISGTILVSEIAADQSIVATDLKDVITHYENNWTTPPENAPFEQMTAKGELLYMVLRSKL